MGNNALFGVFEQLLHGVSALAPKMTNISRRQMRVQCNTADSHIWRKNNVTMVTKSHKRTLYLLELLFWEPNSGWVYRGGKCEKVLSASLINIT